MKEIEEVLKHIILWLKVLLLAASIVLVYLLITQLIDNGIEVNNNTFDGWVYGI